MILLRSVSVNRKVIITLISIILIAGCANTGKSKKDSETTVRTSGPYLQRNVLPDSLALLPPPPEKGSAALAYDEEVNKRSQKLRGTPRWEMAIRDANLRFPEAAETFSCALNAPVTEKDTPRLYILLRRSMLDAALATFSAKHTYKRERPFVVKKQQTCTQGKGVRMRGNDSYPSGHSAIGWAWALILTEIAPERANAILARGRAFGESRIVCNVHWYSDVLWGRFVGSATVARLHADSAFCADVEAAKAELENVWEKGLKPACDCEAEAEALKCQCN